MTDRIGKADLVYSYVLKKIEYLKSIADLGTGKAALAELRHGIGRKPGELPSLWGLIFESMPEELLGRNDASYAEWAVYTSLTLYALHRQGCEHDVFRKGISVGRAAACLEESEEDRSRVVNRLNTVVTAVSPEDLAYHLRGMIQLFKRKDICLDYAQLAKDLYDFNNAERADRVKLRWGRDFYNEIYNKQKEGKNNG